MELVDGDDGGREGGNTMGPARGAEFERQQGAGPGRVRQAAAAKGEHGLGPTNGADDSGVELPGTPELTLFGISLCLSHRHHHQLWRAGQSCTATQYRYRLAGDIISLSLTFTGE